MTGIEPFVGSRVSVPRGPDLCKPHSSGQVVSGCDANRTRGEQPSRAAQ